jgi:predicted AAA+ superfamily ATPase
VKVYVFVVAKDNFPKYLITADDFDASRNGIRHVNIVDWLQGPSV